MTDPGTPSDPPSSGERAASDPARAAWFERFLLLRPTFGILLVFLMIVGGLTAYSSMIKESYPDLAIPQATVQTEWPGADPETIEQQITNPIEKQIKSLKGLKRYRSASFDSFSVVAVEFRAEADLGDAMQRLRAKVSEAEAELPSGAEKPKIEQVSVDDTPIATIAIFGRVDEAILSRAADDLKDRLEKTPGVNKVTLGGKRDEVVHVLLDPTRVAALGLSPTTIKQRIGEANLDMPWDRIEMEDGFRATVRLYGRFREVDDLRNLPVARLDPSGRVVRLREVADVRRDLEREKTRASLSFGGSEFEPCVDVSVTKAPRADTIEVIRRVLDEVEAMKLGPEWPHGMEARVTSDQSIDIRANLRSVFDNGWQAMLCVFLVLFVMLSWREALVAGLAIPLTFLGALAVVWGLGYTLNQMIVIGMVLALGLLVDVFILMMEGMHEGLFVKGLRFDQAALETARTYSAPAFAGQMTTVLAMAPLMAIAGTDGKFIRIIPVTAIACLALSFLIALAVCIPLSRYLFRGMSGGDRKTRVDVLTERWSAALCRWSLGATLTSRRRALAWLGGGAALLVLSFMGMAQLPTLLYPKADGRKLGVTIEMSPGTTLDEAQACADAVGESLRGEPFLESVVKFVGKKSPLALNSIGESLQPSEDARIVGFSCMFTLRAERDKLAFEYLDDLRGRIEKDLRRFPGSQLILTPETGGSTTEDPVQIELIGDDMDHLREIAARVREALRRTPGATDARDNLGPARQDARIIPRREALDFYGVSTAEMAEQIRFAMANDEIGKFPLGGTREDLEIRLGTAWPSRAGEPGGPTTLEELALARVFRPNGETVSIMSLADAMMGQAPLSITRKNGRRAVTVMCKTAGRSAGEIAADMTPKLEAMRAEWPAGYDFQFAGELESSAETFGSATKMLGVAAFLVFALLVIQFDSFRQPFIIMLAAPMALIGTCGGFFLAWIPFSFPAMIGVISLVGIVVNDAIVMIETMNNHRRAGRDAREAAARGGADRLRPILSTTVTTVVGLTPLALSDPMWMPLCSAIIFGLLVATVASLVLIPCLYLLLEGGEGR